MAQVTQKEEEEKTIIKSNLNTTKNEFNGNQSKLEVSFFSHPIRRVNIYAPHGVLRHSPYGMLKKPNCVGLLVERISLYLIKRVSWFYCRKFGRM